jgi:molybdate transport system regulatory protein
MDPTSEPRDDSRQSRERLSPHFRLWLSDAHEDSPLGPGKGRLLAAIEHEGSLSAAAAALGMSYRKAWGDLRDAERALGVRLVAARRGGRGGGVTRLTDEGRRWLGAFQRFEREVAAAVARTYAECFADLVPEAAPEVSRDA